MWHNFLMCGNGHAKRTYGIDAHRKGMAVITRHACLQVCYSASSNAPMGRASCRASHRMPGLPSPLVSHSFPFFPVSTLKSHFPASLSHLPESDPALDGPPFPCEVQNFLWKPIDTLLTEKHFPAQSEDALRTPLRGGAFSFSSLVRSLHRRAVAATIITSSSALSFCSLTWRQLLLQVLGESLHIVMCSSIYGIRSSFGYK